MEKQTAPRVRFWDNDIRCCKIQREKEVNDLVKGLIDVGNDGKDQLVRA